MFSTKRNAVLQDTLTFKTLSMEEILKRVLKFEQIKQTTQAIQKTKVDTAVPEPGVNPGSAISIKGLIRFVARLRMEGTARVVSMPPGPHSCVLGPHGPV